MSARAALLLIVAAPALGACATTAPSQAALPDYTPYSALTDENEAASALAASLEEARGSDKKVLAIFGADWCHDSRALAGWLQTPRFKALADSTFEIVYLDAGQPGQGRGQNLALAAEHGVPDIAGTPSVLVLDGEGRLLNSPEDARSWRNAASRDEEAIYAALERYAAIGA